MILCGNEESLHVHHRKYLPDKEPWDYENKYLETLCERCHKLVHIERKILKEHGFAHVKEIIGLINRIGFDPVDDCTNLIGRWFLLSTMERGPFDEVV